MRREFDRRRQVLIEVFCNGADGLTMVRPRGAFYGMLDIRCTGMNSEEAARFFLREAGVAMVPGSAFGEYGEGYLRVAYSNSYENVSKAVAQIKEAARRML
jgi:aminotransferase